MLEFIDRLPSYDYEKIFFYGWKTSIALILLGMTASFLAFGLFYPYWQFSDQDLILAYQGLLFNDGRAQAYFDHPGYLYYLLIGGWYRLCHWLGVLPVHALSALPPARDVAAFETAWQHLVYAGRVLSLLLGGLFVWVFATLLRRLIGDWRIAALAGLALAFSGGIAMHIRVMRTELLSAGFVTTALLLVLVSATLDRPRRRTVLLGLAGLCSALAVVAKVQALLPVLAIPAIALAFGRRPYRDTDRAAGQSGEWVWAGIVAVVALAAAVPAASLFLQGMTNTGQAIIRYQPLGVVPPGVYQLLIALWVIAAMIAYAAIWRIRAANALAAMAAVLLGVSLGLLALLIRFHEQNLLAITHPIEHMFTFASWRLPELAQESQVLSETLFATLARGFASAIAAHAFISQTSSRPTLMFEWLAIIGAVVLWRRGDRRLPLQIGLLLLVVWGLDTVFTLRGLKREYLVYTDPLLIMAAALVAARFPELLTSLRAQKIGICLFAIYIVWAHLEPARPVFKRYNPEGACEWLPHYLKEVERFPFCRS